MEIKVLVPLMLKLSNILLFKSTKTNILKVGTETLKTDCHIPYTLEKNRLQFM